MKLTKEEFESVKNRLKMKMCPICLDRDRTNFIISEDLTQIPIYSKNNSIPDDLIEAYMVVCAKCGYVHLFSKLVLDGLYPDVKDPI